MFPVDIEQWKQEVNFTTMTGDCDMNSAYLYRLWFSVVIIMS